MTNKPNIPTPPPNPNQRVNYTTASGKTVQLRGVSPVLIERVRDGFTKQNPPPKRPTYEAKKAGGDVELLPHDETTVETTEEKADYLAWTEAQEAWDRELNDRIMGLITARGVLIPQEEIDDPVWWQIQEMLGVQMPDKGNPIAVRKHYIETEVIGSPEDLAEILAQVMLISGVDKEVADTLRALFRPDVSGEEDNG